MPTRRPGLPGAPAAPATLRGAARAAVEAAWERAAATGALPALPADPQVSVEIERPASAEHGDLATNLALKLARPLRMAPAAIAAALTEAISEAIGTGAGGPVAEATVAGPGFVNLRLADRAIEALLDSARAEPAAWGRAAAPGSGRKVNVEFVSANPTGPLTVGNARGAFVGDLLCRVLEAGGQVVTREYYFNDSGAQVQKLGASVIAILGGRAVPEDGYHGDYVGDLAREVPPELLGPGTAVPPDEAAEWAVGRWASQRIRAGIEASLERLGVDFDVWTTEGSLQANGWVDRAIARLREGGHLYEADGATWFRSTAFGDDKDRVVVRSDGSLTYFAFDVGYVTEKFSRGFDHLIYIWGVDHHGTVARNRNAAEAMGFPREHVEMLLVGWVRFIRDGVEVSMSKRAGTFITLDELLAEIGPDAARWFFASRGANVNIDFDIELAKKQSNENPVYYVQYAHARIASILRKAAEAGLAASPSLGGTLAGGPEAALARIVARYPEVVEDAAAAEETQGVTTFATELATAFHAFYRDAKVVDPSDPGRSSARLALVDVTRITLANALALLGISAPDSM
ncbi:MAG TPA: arginine--tRNA ligase [Candidatus Limnocylindrales bacterium]|nr:arginine--tRNA ligase [Candidatus Limnocylindrales bacterium]